MTDVFISYARVNRDTAQALAVALEAGGLSVWWDRELTGGGDFAAEIEQHLWQAPVALVLWSAASVRSDFVRDESARARDRDTLLPVRIEPVGLPLGFGTLHTLDLLDWDGDPEAEAFLALQAQVQAQVRARRAAAAAAGGGSETGAGTGAGAASRAGAASGADSSASLSASPGRLDPLARQRARRRWFTHLGGVAVLAVGGGAWLTWRASQQRQALEHLARGLGHQFGPGQGQAQALVEYRLATQFDPELAEAYYYWAHLAVADLGRSAPFLPGEREGLQRDAIDRFSRALARPQVLGAGRTAVARQHLALLSQEEAAPVARVALAGPEPAPPAPGAAAGDEAGGSTAAGTGTGTGITLGSGTGAVTGTISGVGAAGRPATGGRPLPGRGNPPVLAASPEPLAPPAVAQRLAMAPARQQQASQQAQALFAAERDSRLAAQSALALDPALAADALPQGLALGLSRWQAGSPDEAGLAGLAALPAWLARSTPLVLQGQAAMLARWQAALAGPAAGWPADLATQLRQALVQAQARAAVAAPPRVYLQIASEAQRPLARRLAAQLVAAGYRVPPLELTGPARAPRQPALRSHGGSDPGLARWCLQAMASSLGAEGQWQPLRQVRADTDTFEIWLDAALCAPAGRPAPGCAA